MNTLSGGRRRKRGMSEQQAITLMVAVFAAACLGLMILVAYGLIERVSQVLGG